MNFSHLTVLIIEDDMSYRVFMRSLMSKTFQMKTLEATNPIDPFEILKENKVDLIILDMQMPAMDGVSALVLLRKEEATKNIPVIISSALSHFGLLAQLSKIGISDYIVKQIGRAHV